MKTASLMLAGAILAGCATSDEHPRETAATNATSAPQQEAIPTVASRSMALDKDCTVIRAMDGRAVCAEQPHETTPVANPAPAGHGVEAAPADFDAIRDTVRVAEVTRHYVVIGSFSNRSNAERWAHFNADFGTRIQPVADGSGTLYRVLVGPLDQNSSTMMREILHAVGLTGSWHLTPCGTHAKSGSCEVFDAPPRLATATTH